ncbi:MAG TPA: polysaccharide biosynthesis protein, partial [Acetobacteraceae bacterium]|nr:polysaccharide biosynthesis protein [Acetobacteraceae bacterium]
MQAARSLIRIAVNVAIDGALAAIAVPLAWWITDPTGTVPSAAIVIPLGSAALLLAGTPFRLSQQYWRFAAIGDLLSVTGSAALGAVLFFVLLYATGLGHPSTGFPLAHGLVLLAVLGAPRVGYRWFRSRGLGPVAEPNATSVLVVGQTEDCDLFLRALGRDRRQRFRVEGVLTPGDRQTGRRIQGYSILGAMKDAGSVLERLRDDGRLPGTLVMATPDLQGGPLASVVAQADRFGLR